MAPPHTETGKSISPKRFKQLAGNVGKPPGASSPATGQFEQAAIGSPQLVSNQPTQPTQATRFGDFPLTECQIVPAAEVRWRPGPPLAA